jgi:hypothetical protein
MAYKKYYPETMSIFSRYLFLSLSVLACLPLAAQESGIPPAAIKVVARKNPGHLPYRFFWDGQRKLDSYLAPEPRKVDMMFRISFTELPEPEQDAYLPQSWGVSVVGDTVDETVKVRRGGYFRLPDLPQAREEGATIMFNEQSRKKVLNVGWIVRIDGGRLRYADFARAMHELRAVQKQISILSISMRTEKHARNDTLKACFLEAGGRLLLGGKPAADAMVGNCALLRFDPAKAASSEDIEFAGPLDIVTIVEGRHDAAGLASAPAG